MHKLIESEKKNKKKSGFGSNSDQIRSQSRTQLLPEASMSLSLQFCVWKGGDSRNSRMEMGSNGGKKDGGRTINWFPPVFGTSQAFCFRYSPLGNGFYRPNTMGLKPIDICTYVVSLLFFLFFFKKKYIMSSTICTWLVLRKELLTSLNNGALHIMHNCLSGSIWLLEFNSEVT